MHGRSTPGPTAASANLLLIEIGLDNDFPAPRGSASDWIPIRLAVDRTTSRDRGNGTGAIGTLMLGAARDTELSMSNQPAERVPIALSGANPTGIAAAKQTATSGIG
jgi:hypothetical protein